MSDVTDRLLQAQSMAQRLLGALDERGVIAPGIRETAAREAIHDLAADLFGGTGQWPREMVRSGPNTLLPVGDDADDPPDRVIGADDIVVCDVGPAVGDCEADVGRTFVLGDDPVKARLRDTLPVIWDAGRSFFESHADVTGAQLHAHVRGLAAQSGFGFGPDAGHATGPAGAGPGGAAGRIGPDDHRPLRRLDAAGRPCHWQLRVHLLDRERRIAGVHEQLLDVTSAELPSTAGRSPAGLRA